MEEGALAPAKKNAARRGQTIVFLDESGLSERPHRRRTWAPRGHTPVLQYHFNWTTYSLIAGLTWWNLYFQLHQGSIKGPQVVGFLKPLLRHLAGPLLILWDRLPAHRSEFVRTFIAPHRRRLAVEYLPAYAPELNPGEYLFGHTKHHALPTFCPVDRAGLAEGARQVLRRTRHRPSLLIAFWKQADLFE